ncbi:hypothetical protein DASC09_018220 [Saccharomycopsis crataegensis]|uniref:Uncharacterized protein n=1 Tax=Saccharomycopsis crataegensis TaxID=43959 RepID=A0AAV5QI72_9ASCO|nr:hypothetical protein DASC09_018220 [Saccharomycopsis crataegensis]
MFDQRTLPSYAQPTKSFTCKKAFASRTNGEATNKYKTIYASTKSQKITPKPKSSGLLSLFSSHGAENSIIRKKRDPFSSPDENKENQVPFVRKAAYDTPVMRDNSDYYEEFKSPQKGLSLRYERVESPQDQSTPFSLEEVNSIINKYYKESKSGGIGYFQSSFPTEYLKSLAHDKDYLSKDEWYKLVDIISALTEALVISQNEEARCLVGMVKDFQQEIIYSSKVCNNAIYELEELETEMALTKENERKLNEIKHFLKIGLNSFPETRKKKTIVNISKSDDQAISKDFGPFSGTKSLGTGSIIQEIFNHTQNGLKNLISPLQAKYERSLENVGVARDQMENVFSDID